MEIRPITDKDIPGLIHMGADMHNESEYRSLEYSPEKIADLCYAAIKTKDVLGLIAVDSFRSPIGVLGATVQEAYFSKDKTALDLLVYVTPKHRGSTAFIKLIKHYVTWAQERGASLIFLRQSTGINTDMVENLYKRLGLHHVGGIFCMEGVRK